MSFLNSSFATQCESLTGAREKLPIGYRAKIPLAASKYEGLETQWHAVSYIYSTRCDLWREMVKGLPACSDHVAFRQIATRRSRSLQSTERSSPFRRQTQSGLGDKRRHGVDNKRRFAVSTVSAITGRLSYTPSRSVSSTSAKRKAFAPGAVDLSVVKSHAQSSPEAESSSAWAHYNPNSAIRQHLRQWQEDQAKTLSPTRSKSISGLGGFGLIDNTVTQSGEDDLNAPSKTNEDDAEWDFGLDVDFESFLEEVKPPEALIARGDMTDVRIRDEVVPAVCTRWVHKFVQLYTVRGQVVHVPATRVTFSIPGMISPAELNPINSYLPKELVEFDESGKGHIPEASIPREAGGPLIKKMLLLNSLADEIYRRHADRCDRVWELMLTDRYAPNIGLEAIALKVFQCNDPADLTSPMLWCLHRVLSNHEAFKKNTRHHRLYPNFRMLSPNQVNNGQTVQQWVRDYQEELASATTAAFDDDPVTAGFAPHENPVRGFLRKARAVIERSRDARDPFPLGCLSPSKESHRSDKALQPIIINPSPVRFSKREAKIVRSVFDWAISELNSDALSSIGPPILRGTGMYDDFNLDKATGLLLLQEMGILLPWQNRSVYFDSKTQPLPGCDPDAKADKMHDMAISATLRLEDSMANLRKDWGDLPVFCIDSLGTVERDDGVSWEAIDESTSWVHVHVANPSAFVDPTSLTAQYAARLSQTIYLPDRQFQMLQPESLRNHCSLAPNKPTLTFSAKLTNDGDIVETSISHGIVRNVKIVTYDTITRILFPEEFIPEASKVNSTVGGHMPLTAHAPRDETLTDSDVEILSNLLEAGIAKRLKRIQGTDHAVVQHKSLAVEPNVYLGEEASPPDLSFDKTRQIVGDPIVFLPIKPFDPKKSEHYASSFQFVGDLMTLAGEIASTWCAERGIPIAYSGTTSNPHFAVTERKFIEDVYKPTVAKLGYVPPPFFLRRTEYMGTATMSTVPQRHEFLNLSKYTRITSPLRRYGDLFNHWQIDAAIRHEARTGMSLVGNTDDSFLPFSSAQSKEIVDELGRRASHIARTTKFSRRHWSVQWFIRAYYYKQAPLPEKLHIYIMRVDYSRPFAQAMIMELGLQCTVERVEFAKVGGRLREGDIWEADVDQVDGYRLLIEMKLLRLVEKSPFEYQTWMTLDSD